MDGIQTRRACPVCGAGEGTPLYENRLAPLAPPDGHDMSYRVAICPACCMAYADRLAPEATYRSYYQAFSKYDLIRSRDSIPPMVATSAEGAVAFLRRYAADAGAVYDIGCSVGVFLDRCRRAGFRVGGIDPAPQARALARDLFDIDIDTGFLDSGASLAAYDIVCLSAVLEHLWSPLASLEQLAGAMRTGSLLYLEVPAGDRFETFAGEVLGEFSIEHINYFGRASLARIAAHAGFIEVASEYCTYPNRTIGLRGLYRLQPALAHAAAAKSDPALATSMGRYVAREGGGHRRQAAAIAQRGSGHLLLYGAGSHSARLLPLLQEQGLLVQALLDRNTNLQGKFMGGIPIMPPEALANLPRLPIVISTYHARHAVSAHLRRNHDYELIDLYACDDFQN